MNLADDNVRKKKRREKYGIKTNNPKKEWKANKQTQDPGWSGEKVKENRIGLKIGVSRRNGKIELSNADIDPLFYQKILYWR